jgi:hypothetical protein
MKKITWILSAALAFGMFSTSASAQAIRDRNVIPVAVNLNEVLRMTITNGGNIEFVFNSIDDYRYGLSGDVLTLDNPQDADVTANGAAANPAGTTGGANAFSFYRTDFTVAASIRWAIDWGAEEVTFIGTDDPLNTLALDHVGFSLVNNGTHQFEGSGDAKATSLDAVAQGDPELFSACTDNANSVTALVAYPSANPLIEDNDDPNDANAGDLNDNSFTLYWRCGTTEEGNGNLGVVAMNPTSLLNLGDINPDRYVTNVVFELRRDF